MTDKTISEKEFSIRQGPSDKKERINPAFSPFPVFHDTNLSLHPGTALDRLWRRYGKGTSMLIVHVFVEVKPDQVEAFKKASLENARNSIKEPGIARFDVIQQQENKTQFVLVEVYRTVEDAAKHKETAHYHKWRDTVADMMAEPRKGVKYDNLFPGDKSWN